MDFRNLRRRDYYFQDEKAFTEDDVLVYNLFVFGIPNEITTNDLETYFKKFGEISHIYMTRSQNYPLRQIGFVNFVKAKDAARVLKQMNHFVNSKCVSVTACYSWQQPDVINSSRTNAYNVSTRPSTSKAWREQQERKGKGDGGNIRVDENVDEDDSNSVLKIIKLNDDVLEHMCSLLRIKDQITFARTCKRFQDVFIMHSKLRYKVFNMAKLWDLTLWQSREFFQLCGAYITVLHGFMPAKGRNRIAEFCGLHCTNVKVLRIPPFNLKPVLLKKMLHKMTAITEINVVGNAINDDLVYFLSHLKHLKILRTTDNSKISGKYFNMLTNIEELGVKYCRNLKVHFVIDSLKELKNLRVLDIQHYELCYEVYRALVQYGQNIEVLKMSAPKSIPYDDVAKLPKLKHLEIINNYKTTSDIFNKLVEYKSEQLEVLIYEYGLYTEKAFSQQTIKNIGKLRKLKILSCSVRYVTNTVVLTEFTKLKELIKLRLQGSFFTAHDLLQILKNCHHLKHMSIIRCPQIKSEFIFQALKIIEDLNDRQLRNYPLRIYVYDSGINRSIKWAHPLRNSDHILQLFLHLPVCKHDDLTDDDNQSGDDEYGTDVDELSNSDYFDSHEDDFEVIFNDRQLSALLGNVAYIIY